MPSENEKSVISILIALMKILNNRNPPSDLEVVAKLRKLVPTILRGNAYPSLFRDKGMGSHAGAWEPGLLRHPPWLGEDVNELPYS